MTFSCGLLESNYTTARLIYPNFQGSNLIAFQGSKIIVGMTLKPSMAPPGGDSRHLDLEGIKFSKQWRTERCCEKRKLVRMDVIRPRNLPLSRSL